MSAAAARHKLFLAEHVVVAPMVRGSERAFRLLLRSLYGPHLTCYTPMLRADAVLVQRPRNDAGNANAAEQEEVNHLLQTDCGGGAERMDDTPLVVQLCGNEPRVLQAACRTILERYTHVSGIDFNLGCEYSTVYWLYCDDAVVLLCWLMWWLLYTADCKIACVVCQCDNEMQNNSVVVSFTVCQLS